MDCPALQLSSNLGEEDLPDLPCLSVVTAVGWSSRTWRMCLSTSDLAERAPRPAVQYANRRGRSGGLIAARISGSMGARGGALSGPCYYQTSTAHCFYWKELEGAGRRKPRKRKPRHPRGYRV